MTPTNISNNTDDSPPSPHVERHFTSGELVRDIVIGMSDGLTVPFALAAGLSGAVAASKLVVTAGLAEVAAGSIAMGLGGFLAARGDAEHYGAERKREEREIIEKPDFRGVRPERRGSGSGHGFSISKSRKVGRLYDAL